MQQKCKLSLNSPLSAKAILYDKDERPKFFAYFVQGGSGQVLDNAHGNVYFGVANGTPCTMHSLAWDDPKDEENAHKAVISLAHRQIQEYPEDGCEGFFCSRLFFCVFVSGNIVFVGSGDGYTLQNDHFFCVPVKKYPCPNNPSTWNFYLCTDNDLRIHGR